MALHAGEVSLLSRLPRDTVNSFPVRSRHKKYCDHLGILFAGGCLRPLPSPQARSRASLHSLALGIHAYGALSPLTLSRNSCRVPDSGAY